MTLPYERTRSVTGARQLLVDLAAAPDNADLEKFRVLSRRLLRHFPDPIDLHLSAGFAPGIWADPDATGDA
ncbi:BPSL0761 family protein [Paraburkholderia sp. RL17-347-BIC-D]|uniref:BPSL0761 family protein n=1 Tax=Paraburkholderia sp. RL17-347-BIC-D TaxID=3031632 RepID=UPI0038BDA908